MASSRDPVAIAIGFMFFGVLQAGAIILFMSFVFDVRCTCDRALDSCVVEHVRPFSREVVEEFRPSQVVRADSADRRKGSFVVLTMVGGVLEIKATKKGANELAARFRDLIANPALPGFQHVAESHVGYFVFSGLFQLLALVLLWATASELMAQRRRSR